MFIVICNFRDNLPSSFFDATFGENGAFWLLRGFILDLGGGGDWSLLFHFILSKIVESGFGESHGTSPEYPMGLPWGMTGPSPGN